MICKTCILAYVPESEIQIQDGPINASSKQEQYRQAHWVQVDSYYRMIQPIQDTNQNMSICL